LTLRPHRDFTKDDIQLLLMYIQNLLYKIEKFGLCKGYSGYPIQQLKNIVQYKIDNKNEN